MKNEHIKAMLFEIAPVIKEYTALALSPLVEKLDALEKRLDALPVPSDGRDGRDADEKTVAEMVREAIKADLDVLWGAVDGVSKAHEESPQVDIPLLVKSAVDEAIRAIPAPENGKDGRDGVDGKDGSSVAVDDVLPELKAHVDEFLKSIPVPKNGRDGRDGEKGERGADGAGVADLLIDRDGNLVATLSDGRIKSLGAVIGRDGADGKAGNDGLDGVGFDDLSFDYDGEKTVTLSFVKGERVKSFTMVMPVVIDRGIYRDDTLYKAGDGVTWGGSFWIAQEDTDAKPEAGKSWRLAVKKGRDGRDGRMLDPLPKTIKVG